MMVARKPGFRLIFICGAERTGTTVLQRILCGDPKAIPVVGELPIIDVMIEAVNRAKAEFDFFYTDYVNSAEDLAAVARAGAAGLIRKIRNKYPKSVVCILKSPSLTTHLTMLRTMFPGAHFVVMRRSALDTVASMDGVARRAKSLDTVRHMATVAGDVAALTRRFLSFYGPLMAADLRALAPLTFVRYESLVNDPDKEIPRLASRLKLDILEPYAADRRMESTYLQPEREAPHSPYWSELYRQPLTGSRVGMHREVFTDEEVSLILELAADYRRWAGYEEDEPS